LTEHAALPPLPAPLGWVPRDLQRRGFAVIRSYGSVTARLRPLPDFLIIGAKRGGTTTLFRALERHPDVASMWPRFARIKSPHYFDLHYEQGPSWYRGHFPIALPGRPRVVGEADPYCLFHPLAPARVAETAPRVRLIAVLRDPVDRAVSHHWDRTRAGIETLPLDDAIAAEGERLAGVQEAMQRGDVAASEAYEHFSYVTRGLYAEQLRDWLRVFPAAQLLVLRSEDLFERPQSVLDPVLEYLGLAPFRPEAFGKHHARADRPALEPAIRERLAPRFAAANSELAELLGTPLWWDVDGACTLDGAGAAIPARGVAAPATAGASR
jgi:Sulfotransferase domain